MEDAEVNGMMDEKEMNVDTEKRNDRNMAYTLRDKLPLPLCLLLGFQHFLMTFMSTPTIPLLMSEPLCMTGDNIAVTELIGVNLVSAGVATLLQTNFGVRLPIIQGPSAAYMAPILSILSLPQWKCPDIVTSHRNVTAIETPHFIFSTVGRANNGSGSDVVEAGSEAHKDIWLTRIREINGAIMVASLLQISLGSSGLLSKLLRYVGPLSIAPTISIIGLGLVDVAAHKASLHWWIALLTMVLIVVFSQCLNRVSLPCPCCLLRRHSSPLQHGAGKHRRLQACTTSTYRIPVFTLFPVLFGVAVTWLICFLFTVTDVFPTEAEQWGRSARTDLRTHILKDATWFRLPYPGQFGLPTVSVGAVLGVIAAVLASIVESVGDYYACAQLADAPPPPPHAINRGIATEGIATMLGAALGTASGSTSHSQNIAAIGVTKVASRPVMVVAGILLIMVGLVGKVAALFVAIPDPILGGLYMVLFGMIIAIGLSQLSKVDLHRGRNQIVIGLSLFLGLCVPRWVSRNMDSIQTGNEVANQMLGVLLANGMIVGGLTGFVLDNLLPGTLEERGMAPQPQTWMKDESGTTLSEKDVYGGLPLIHTLIQRFSVLSRLPFCPPADTSVNKSLV